MTSRPSNSLRPLPFPPPPLRLQPKDAKYILENLAQGIDTNDLHLLTTTIERGLSQTPPLQHKTMEEAKTMVEAHKRKQRAPTRPRGTSLDAVSVSLQAHGPKQNATQSRRRRKIKADAGVAASEADVTSPLLDLEARLVKKLVRETQRAACSCMNLFR